MILLDKTLIVNEENLKFVPEQYMNKVNIITCGLSQKAWVTASSISDHGFLYCIQHGFFAHNTSDKPMIVPQEFNIKWHKKAENIYPYLEMVTLMLLCGLNPDDISNQLNLFDIKI